MMARRIASKGVYSLVVMAPPNACLAVLEKYFAGKLIPGAKVTRPRTGPRARDRSSDHWDPSARR